MKVVTVFSNSNDQCKLLGIFSSPEKALSAIKNKILEQLTEPKLFFDHIDRIRYLFLKKDKQNKEIRKNKFG